MRLTVKLPVPDYRLTGNGNAYRLVKASLVKSHRYWAKVCCQHAVPEAGTKAVGKGEPLFPRGAEVKVVWELRQGSREARGDRELDGDNAAIALKPYWDGFTDARVWEDDRGVKYFPVEFKRVKGQPSVIVTVTTPPE